MAKYRLTAMEMWYRQVPGSLLFQIEQAQLLDMLRHIPGKRLLQLGGTSDLTMLKKSHFPLQYYLGSQLVTNIDGLRMEGMYSQLPLAAESFDVIVLIHMLEFETHLQQTLEECYRVLVPGGQMIIFTFNPWSLWGFAKLRNGNKGFPWQGVFRSTRQIKHLLSEASFRILANKTLCFRPPLENAAWFKRLLFLEAVGQIFLPGLGGVILITAQKEALGMTPLVINWRSKKVAVTNGCAEPTLRNF